MERGKVDWVLLIKGTAPPVLVALALVSAGGQRLLPLAIAIGMSMAFVLLAGWPVLPHELWRRPDGMQWLYWSAMAAMLVSSLEVWRCVPARAGAVLGIALAGTAVWLVLQEIARRQSIGWNVLQVGGGSLVVAATLVAQRRLVGRSQGSPFLPAFAVAILGADAVVMVLGDCPLIGRLGGAAAAALGAGIATGLWRRPFALTVADGTWFGLLHALFLLAAVHLGGLDWQPALLAGIAPVLPLALPKSFAKERPKCWMLTAVTLAAIPATFSIVVS